MNCEQQLFGDELSVTIAGGQQYKQKNKLYKIITTGH